MKTFIAFAILSASLQSFAYEPPFDIADHFVYNCDLQSTASEQLLLKLNFTEQTGQKKTWAEGKTAFYIHASLNDETIRNSVTTSAAITKSFKTSADLLTSNDKATAWARVLKNLSSAEGILLDLTKVNFVKNAVFPKVQIEIQNEKSSAVTTASGTCVRTQ